jgi:hypothetical protein
MMTKPVEKIRVYSAATALAQAQALIARHPSPLTQPELDPDA